MVGADRRYVERINAQYGGRDLAESILRRARKGKAEGARLSPPDLYAFDQVHTGGAEATRELVAMAGFGRGQRILDVGSGLGGSARWLAAEVGCLAEGLDLTQSYHDAARRLTEEVGLSREVQFHLGDATALAFPDGAFDGVLLQHCTMNIPDKGRLFAGCARVLRQGGLLALHEWVKVGREPMILPVRWADTPEINFIAPRADFEEALGRAGLAPVEVRDVCDEGRRWMEAQAAQAESPRAQLLFNNMARNLAEARAVCLMGVYCKA
jgi:SAM-dependent methyltransferase